MPLSKEESKKAITENTDIVDLSEPEPQFYGEWVNYENEEDKQKAEQYLDLWKYFIQKKLKPLVLNDEKIVDKPNILNSGIGTLGIKIEMIHKKL